VTQTDHWGKPVAAGSGPGPGGASPLLPTATAIIRSTTRAMRARAVGPKGGVFLGGGGGRGSWLRAKKARDGVCRRARRGWVSRWRGARACDETAGCVCVRRGNWRTREHRCCDTAVGGRQGARAARRKPMAPAREAPGALWASAPLPGSVDARSIPTAPAARSALPLLVVSHA
jgi:hypothetical protein